MRFPVLVQIGIALCPKLINRWSKNSRKRGAWKQPHTEHFLVLLAFLFRDQTFTSIVIWKFEVSKTAILTVKLSGYRYAFGHKSLVKSVVWQDSQASQSKRLSDAFL